MFFFFCQMVVVLYLQSLIVQPLKKLQSRLVHGDETLHNYSTDSAVVQFVVMLV